MRFRALVIGAQIGLLAATGCAAPTGSEGSEDILGYEGGKADAAEDKIVNESDNGTTVEITEGQALVLRLGSNPSTGYSWRVVSTDRTFGYPTETFESPRRGHPLVGAPGTQVFRWETAESFLSLVGSHSIRLEYARGTGAAADSYDLTVDVKAAEEETTAVIVDEDDNGATVSVTKGQEIKLRLSSNPSTGYSWVVTRVDRSFGAPEETFESPPTDVPLVGAGGTQVFTWVTGGLFPSIGLHTVQLEYKRPWEDEAIETFEFTVDLRDAAPAAVRISESDDGKTFDVKLGQPVELRVQSSAFHGISWRVISTDRTFGYPAISTEPGLALVDGPSTTLMTWGANPLLQAGESHTVVLERSSLVGETSQLTFTIRIVE